MLNLNGLNPPQRQAATTIDGPILILAGAGTGKTRVITHRIAYMLEKGIKPETIVGLTFTNKAAREMRERARVLSGENAKRVFLGTFHSFCLKILRQFHVEAGIERQFSLLGTSDQVDIIRRCMDEKGWAGVFRPETLLTQVSTAKNKLLTPAQIRANPKLVAKFTDDAGRLADCYELYERQLRVSHAIDFDDCIFKVVMLLRANPKICEQLQKQYQYLMVDEFQDTNFAQLEVIRFIAGTKHNVCVVGDDDQSIYSWRGAMMETLTQFEEHFPGTLLIKLEQNYRSTDIILNAANSVIKNNTLRKEKSLWSDAKGSHPIQLGALENENEEAMWISQQCITLLGQDRQLKDIVIIYRANAQSKALELALRESRLTYKTFGGQSFFERKEVKDFLAYVRLIFNHKDRLSFLRIINTPSRGIGIKSLEKIDELSRAMKLAPLAALEHEDLSLPGKSNESARQFAASIKQLGQMTLSDPIHFEDLGHAIIKSFELETAIKEDNKDIATRLRKLENLRTLPVWLRHAAKAQLTYGGHLDPAELIDRLTLDDRDDEDEEKKGNHISLMTIHAAKGLEFPVVFVCGLEEDLLPHKNSLLEAVGIAEERRLFYVAITRAKEKLYLTYAMQRYSGTQKQTRVPSRFLKELPTDEILDHRKSGAAIMTADDRKQETIHKIASLRGAIFKDGARPQPRK